MPWPTWPVPECRRSQASPRTTSGPTGTPADSSSASSVTKCGPDPSQARPESEESPVVSTESDAGAEEPANTLIEPPFVPGFVGPKPGHYPNASDYEADVEALILRTCAEVSVRILTVDGFASISLRNKWANEAWDLANDATRIQGKPHKRYRLTENIEKLTSARGSLARNKVLKAFRPHFADHYKFTEIEADDPDADVTIAANRVKSQNLIKNSAFHYQVPETLTGFGENGFFALARGNTLASSVSKFRSSFDPLPAPYLALEFCVLEHLASEWSTGTFVAAKFRQKEMKERYLKHLEDINKWCEGDPEGTKKIRAGWFESAIARKPGPRQADEDEEGTVEDALAA
ncbi:hypothetical protein FB45DRAFT_932171 [Roridomyces roridus]|uniref:DUF6532 domain-containing protein n=1 Tax=Roridomyces roridus TaxID=1738132 RepID=A0AAD7FGC2_9AGAR|nr:hypothetical protein FB45DRAFT_932171 [Roridomyces roridus]